MGARWYLPEIGRFLSVDPLWSAFPAMSPYVYANDNPMSFKDPTGLAPEKEKKSGGKILTLEGESEREQYDLTVGICGSPIMQMRSDAAAYEAAVNDRYSGQRWGFTDAQFAQILFANELFKATASANAANSSFRFGSFSFASDDYGGNGQSRSTPTSYAQQVYNGLGKMQNEYFPAFYCFADGSQNRWFRDGDNWKYRQAKENEGGGYNEFLEFDGAHLTWYKPDGTTSQWGAGSGRLNNGETDPSKQSEANVGPIPEGDYIIYPDELESCLTYRGEKSELNLIKNYLRWCNPQHKNAWGDFRIAIHPFYYTNTYGRDNMYIHGGLIPGSAGCIDLTSDMTTFAIYCLMSSDRYFMLLFVKYKNRRK